MAKVTHVYSDDRGIGAERDRRSSRAFAPMINS
jgi:hypothetical protein